jgi:hypothetical protein
MALPSTIGIAFCLGVGMADPWPGKAGWRKFDQWQDIARPACDVLPASGLLSAPRWKRAFAL